MYARYTYLFNIAQYVSQFTYYFTFNFEILLKFSIFCICVCVCVSAYVLVAQSCLTLYDPMDSSLPGFSVHGIL